MFKKGYYANEGLGLAWDCVRNVLKVNLLRDFGGKKRDFLPKKILRLKSVIEIQGLFPWIPFFQCFFKLKRYYYRNMGRG